MTAAMAIVVVAKAYLLTGIAVAVPFLVFGVGRADPSASGAYGFRVLVFPGVVLLWPLVVLRWAGKWTKSPDGNPEAQRRAHLRIWTAMAILLTAAFALAWGLRQPALPEPPSKRLSQAGDIPAHSAQALPGHAATGFGVRIS
jgi:hypothetical protein